MFFIHYTTDCNPRDESNKSDCFSEDNLIRLGNSLSLSIYTGVFAEQIWRSLNGCIENESIKARSHQIKIATGLLHTGFLIRILIAWGEILISNAL